jgi:hypothetical protein
MVVIEDKDWPEEDAAKDSCLELKRREVNSFIRTKGCRRRILGRCLDSDLQDCKGIEAVLYNNYRREEVV